MSWFANTTDDAFGGRLRPAKTFEELAGASRTSDSDKMDALFSRLPPSAKNTVVPMVIDGGAPVAKPKKKTTEMPGKWKRNKLLASGKGRSAVDDDVQPTPKQLLPDVQRFVMRAAKSSADRQAEAVRIAVELGAKPPKNSAINYKQFKLQQKQRKEQDKAQKLHFTHPELNNKPSKSSGGQRKMKRLQQKSSNKRRR